MVGIEDKADRGAEPDAELKELLRQNYRRTTWTFIAALVAVILSIVSIVLSVAAIFVLAGAD